MAALNAARAIIFEKTGKATKTHSGVRAQLHTLIHAGLRFDADLANFLTKGFDVKQRADYGPVLSIGKAEAEEFIKRAEAFLAAARAAIEGGS